MAEASERTIEKTSDFCEAMAFVICEMTRLCDCDKDSVRTEIDTPVSREWNEGPEAIARVIFETVGMKYNISLPRIEAEVNFYFRTDSDDEISVVAEHAEVEDPALALENFTRTLRDDCVSRATGVDVAIGDSIQDLSRPVGELVAALHRSLRDRLLPTQDELRDDLLRAIPELDMNPATPDGDEDNE